MMPRVLHAVADGATSVDAVMVQLGMNPEHPTAALDYERQRITQVLDVAVQDGTITWPRGQTGNHIEGGIRLAQKVSQ
jgi:hypothetical protein